ncbi:MAG: prepilin-type N-terminal cleavage/methylation domain-containing protein, partial [Planctomycetota bacterium]
MLTLPDRMPVFRTDRFATPQRPPPARSMKMPTTTPNRVNLATAHRRGQVRTRAATTHTVKRRAAKTRTAFTLVEMLVVLGIIALIAAIVTVGIFSALGNTGDNATRVRLETLTTMYSNWEQDTRAASNAGAQAGGRRLPSSVRTSMGTAASNGAEVPPVSANADSAFDGIVVATDEGSHEIWALRTQQMIRRMLTVNSNRELFASLPDDA